MSNNRKPLKSKDNILRATSLGAAMQAAGLVDNISLVRDPKITVQSFDRDRNQYRKPRTLRIRHDANLAA